MNKKKSTRPPITLKITQEMIDEARRHRPPGAFLLRLAIAKAVPEARDIGISKDYRKITFNLPE